MTLSTDITKELVLENGKRIGVGSACKEDALKIRWLYHRIYGGEYPFSLVYNAEECVKAIGSEKYLWLLAREDEQVVGSVVFTFDREIRLGKVFGSVVSEELRGLDLTEQIISLGLDILLRQKRIARSVYATTRTVSQAPQRIVEKLGFKRLGIFPNVHKVNVLETHTLAVCFGEGVLEEREGPPRLPRLLEGFFDIARRETGIGEAEFVDLPVKLRGNPGFAQSFELVQAPQFVLRRFRELKKSGKLFLDFFPFHEPNILLVSPDGKTEIYCYRSAKDGHCVVTGAFSDSLEACFVLDFGARFLENLGTRYVEVLIDARSPERIQHALNAGFLPSAYYPAMRWNPKTAKAKDYVVLSRSLAVLDFKDISLQPVYLDYLQEYFRLWRSLHIDKVFRDKSSDVDVC